MQKCIEVQKDPEGKNTVFINNIIFRGKRKINWNEVECYVRQYVGDSYSVISTGDYIYIGKDFPDEVSSSIYTRNLKGTSAKAKANAVQGLAELIQIADGKHHEMNKEPKHAKDAKNGWYRYNTRFALPVYDEWGKIKRYNLFFAILLIRHDENGRLYLYDILDVKKGNEQPA